LGDYSTVKKTNVTPAEAALLIKLHRPSAGQMPILQPVAVGEVERSDFEELDRLRKIYGGKTIKAAWPGVTPTLPQAFSDVGVKVAAPLPPATEVAPSEDPAPVEVPKRRGRKPTVEVEQTANPE
jgi:hypothetical protein